ncbi:MAG: 50S ribosomal protein L11 methyltransferase [Mariprofundaceae bacterium]
MQASRLFELRIRPLADEREAASVHKALAGFSPAGFAEETDADRGERCLIAWFDPATTLRDAVLDTLAKLGIDPGRMQWRELAATDWSLAWQEHWRAMPVGRRLWVRPSFREAAPEGRLDIVLDPGMAFGTGQHETTRLCLEAIERLIDANSIESMLDMGAGSGILAIAAGKLGMSHIVAIDNDPDAVDACRVNAGINGVAIEARLADTPPRARFDLVVANILVGPLIEMAPALAFCAGRWLVLSGILTEQEQAVAAAYEAEGLEIRATHRLGDWAALEMARPLNRS